MSTKIASIRTEFRLLIAVVIVMMSGLIGSLVILTRTSHSLIVAHDVIVTNAAPTVVVLDEAQAQLRTVHALVLERELGRGDELGLQRESIVEARRKLDDTINEYLALPYDPGETPLQQAVITSLSRVDRVVDRALDLKPGAYDEPIVRRELDGAVADLGINLSRASAFSADVTKKSADHVEGISKRLLRLGAAIQVGTFVAAMLVLALTYRAVRDARELASQSVASLERRAEELESFSGRVAHDLLSPLMTVSLALDLASRRLTKPEDATAREAVARASKTLQRVRRFVSDLLDFARAGALPTPGVRTRVDEILREVADEFAPIARDAGVDLAIAPAGSSCEVACSSGVLISVVSNLVQNAIKYIGNGEVHRVSVRAMEDAEAKQVRMVRIEVEDTGPGIAEQDRERLFDPYVRGHGAKGQGLGLGLATVKRLVESHGGHIGVRTKLGHGSVFWFSLPAATPHQDGIGRPDPL